MSGFDEYRIRLHFVTPAFIGGADQSSELRTPPFKSLLRRWWRVVHVGGQRPNLDELREKEGRLFGHAWLEDGGKVWASRSRVRLRMGEWSPGTLKRWVGEGQVVHPEVGRGGQRVGAHLYLGYGPLGYEKASGTVLKRSSAIAAGAECDLLIRARSQDREDLQLRDVVRLWAWFGTVGSRSRNGWGSIEVAGGDIPVAPDSPDALRQFSRRFEDCFDSDWPHAIGRDGKGLLMWGTKTPAERWDDAMKALAEIKIKIRTNRKFAWNLPSGCDSRHVLAYPVTNHKVPAWEAGGNESYRLANQLVFKVLRVSSPQGARYRALAVHLPHRLPEPMVEALGDPKSKQEVRKREQGVWQDLHRELDDLMVRWQ